MRTRKITALALGVILIFGMLMIGCSGGRALGEPSEAGESLPEGAAEEPGSQGGQLKTFEAKTLDGGTFTQEDIAAKDVTLINFWATYCGPCVEEMPGLAKLEKALPESVGLVTVCLDGGMKAESAKQILEDAGFEGLTLTEGDGDLADLVGELQYTPTTILVDGDGNLLGEAIIGGRDGGAFAEIINQASAWARLGYSTSGAASMMAKLSSQFAAISPGMGGSDAAASLASVMDAYGIDAGHVLDGVMSKINMVGKHFGTSNAEIAEGLRQSSSAMASAGGSIEDNIALFAGGQEIVQNASQVSEAIRGICMRVQGYSEETGQYSESLADLDSKITGLTKTAGNGGGISLFTDGSQSEHKNLVAYLGEIAAIWDKLAPKAQAGLAESLFGKNSAQAGAAIIENFDQVRRSIEYMGSSDGSADAEMSAVMDSLEYKLGRLSETGTGVAQNLFAGSDLKTAVDVLNAFADILDTVTGELGLFKTAALGIGGILGAKNLGQQKTDRRRLCGAQYIPRAGVGIPGQNTKNYAM